MSVNSLERPEVLTSELIPMGDHKRFPAEAADDLRQDCSLASTRGSYDQGIATDSDSFHRALDALELPWAKLKTSTTLAIVT
jgi:hypothetical protein